ncbi:MAG: hypothetical protein ACJ8GJ_04700 [Vitreoscilla sp.]
MSLVVFLAAAAATRTDSGDMRVAQYFPAFALGIWWSGRAQQSSTQAWLPATGAAIAACALSLAFAADPQYSLTAMPLATFGALAAFLLAGRAQLSPESRLARVAGLLAYAGFSMYLFHRPVYKGLHALWDPASGAGELGYLLLVCLPLVVAVAFVVQSAYDWSLRRATAR